MVWGPSSQCIPQVESTYVIFLLEDKRKQIFASGASFSSPSPSGETSWKVFGSSENRKDGLRPHHTSLAPDDGREPSDTQNSC